MAVTHYPIHIQSVKRMGITISAANTNRDGTGTLVDGPSGGTDGSRIQRIRIKANVSTTAGMVRIFHHDGTTFRLIHEFIVAVVTAAAAVKTHEDELSFPDGFSLPSGHKLSASTHNAESFSVHFDYADY